MNFLRKTFGWTTNPTDLPSEPSINTPLSPRREADTEPQSQPEAGSVGAALWNVLSSKIGGDVLMAGISLPSWLYEPLSILQRQAEMIEYGEVLCKADGCEDPVERLAFVAGFAVSGYSATQRYKPDFNPLLGETFEFVDPRNNTKFFAEQVSHHPPVSALQASKDDQWVFWQNSSPATKFLGNCIDLDTQGRSHILFPKKNEHYFYTNPQCTRIHNIIIGSMWIEHFGTLSIKNMDGSMQCNIAFKKSGLFQGTQYKVEGYIEDNNGKKLVKIEGKWNEKLEGKWLEDTLTVKKGETRTLWTISLDNFLHDQYNFTKYTVSLNRLNPDEENIILPSDSRRRLDRKYLELGDTDTATHWKKIIEERQRSDRRQRKESWQPVWFRQVEYSDAVGEGKSMWVYNGDFWDYRKKKEEALREGQFNNAKMFPDQIRNLACDFTSYEALTVDANLVILPESILNELADTDNLTDNTTDTATDPPPKQSTGNNGGDDTDTDSELEGWTDATDGQSPSKNNLTTTVSEVEV